MNSSEDKSSQKQILNVSHQLRRILRLLTFSVPHAITAILLKSFSTSRNLQTDLPSVKIVGGCTSIFREFSETSIDSKLQVSEDTIAEAWGGRGASIIFLSYIPRLSIFSFTITGNNNSGGVTCKVWPVRSLALLPLILF